MSQLILSPFTTSAIAKETRINAVIGDVSWMSLHDSAPESVDEKTRIRAHLNYVIAKLRAADTSHLALAQQQRRTHSLDHLADYTTAGIFPRRAPNDGFLNSRRPRFIDDRGVHCAVGELIRHSGHPALAQTINKHWEFAHVQEMHSPELVAWAELHGFSVVELAMIQPMYASGPLETFIFTFFAVLIFAGWLGSLFTAGILLPWREWLKWGHFVVIAVGGAFFLAFQLSTLFFLVDLLPKVWFANVDEVVVILVVGAILQIAYSLGSYRLLKSEMPPFAEFDEADLS